MWQRVAMIGVGSLLMAGATASALGQMRWRSVTGRMRERLLRDAVPPPRKIVQLSELSGLPLPVQRYFRAVLVDGQPIIAAMRMTQTGAMNMSVTEQQWRDFTATQLVATEPPGFDWDARIRMLPGMAAHVHDAYIEGEGILSAKFLGLFSVADVRGTPEAARGELFRFLAEGPWYPTALLPGPKLAWTPVNDSAARATLVDRGTSVSVVFGFGADGLIVTMRAEGRDRIVDGVSTTLPWTGRFWNYMRRHGMRVPLNGEVAWELPEGPSPYWRGRVETISYDFVD